MSLISVLDELLEKLKGKSLKDDPSFPGIVEYDRQLEERKQMIEERRLSTNEINDSKE